MDVSKLMAMGTATTTGSAVQGDVSIEKIRAMVARIEEAKRQNHDQVKLMVCMLALISQSEYWAFFVLCHMAHERGLKVVQDMPQWEPPKPKPDWFQPRYGTIKPIVIIPSIF